MWILSLKSFVKGAEENKKQGFYLPVFLMNNNFFIYNISTL